MNISTLDFLYDICYYNFVKSSSLRTIQSGEMDISASSADMPKRHKQGTFRKSETE